MEMSVLAGFSKVREVAGAARWVEAREWESESVAPGERTGVTTGAGGHLVV